SPLKPAWRSRAAITSSRRRTSPRSTGGGRGSRSRSPARSCGALPDCSGRGIARGAPGSKPDTNAPAQRRDLGAGLLLAELGCVDVSAVIATFNRALDLSETLQSLSRLHTTRRWELIVVDNNSTDHTRRVVRMSAAQFPVEVRYVFERRPGRSPAL